MKGSGRRARSRVETNFIRLASRCEDMSKDAEFCASPDSWKLGKYVATLEIMLNELKNGPNQPDRDKLLEYTRRVEFLKGIIHTAQLPTLAERVVASQLIQPGPVASTSVGLTSSMEIKHRHNAKYVEDMRKELLGDTSSIDGGITGERSGDNDDLVKYHHSIQEKIADHMLDLAREIKKQASDAGKIVRKDTALLEKSSDLVDRNQGTLRTETDKLALYNKRACKCWIWLLLAIVCSIFIAMVLFMRLFKKRVV